MPAGLPGPGVKPGGRACNFRMRVWRLPGGARKWTAPFVEIAGLALSATGIAPWGGQAAARRVARIRGAAWNLRSGAVHRIPFEGVFIRRYPFLPFAALIWQAARAGYGGTLVCTVINHSTR